MRRKKKSSGIRAELRNFSIWFSELRCRLLAQSKLLLAPRPLYNQSLLSDFQPDMFTVVLVSPRNPLNIGAAARAMANFGFSHLAVVGPYEPHWREARSAVGAEDLLQNAAVTQHLSDAVADCSLVLGTGSLTRRKPEQPVIALPNLTSLLQNKEKTALVFGPEKHGLTLEDLSLCHYLVEIPTHPRQPSMNLAQAVAVCLYELSTHAPGSIPSQLTTNLGAPGPLQLGTGDRTGIRPAKSDNREAAPATAADLDLLSGVIGQTLTAANYSPAAMRKANRADLQQLLRRLTLTRSDARRILGAFRRILFELRRHP
jgi:TrmH family RNA methyltransferase